MALTALKGKKTKRKSNRAKARSGIAHVPLHSFDAMVDYVHHEVSRKEIIAHNKKYVKKHFKKLLNCEEWVFFKPTITMTTLWKDTGQEFPVKWDSERALNKFKSSLEKYQKDTNQETPGMRKMIQTKSPTDIIKERTSDFIGGVEEILDHWIDNESYSVFDELKKVEAPYIMAKKVNDFYSPLQKELTELVHEKPSDLLENYSHLSSKDQRAYLKFVSNIVSDTDKYMATKKANRAVRKPKVRTADKQISRLNYLKESNEFKLASVNPLTIVGSHRLFTFNTKNKILSELVSNSTKGFEVSGSTIKNVDNSESREITLRNPDQTLPEILKNTKRNIDKVWAELTTKTRTTNSRINSNTILLRILDK